MFYLPYDFRPTAHFIDCDRNQNEKKKTTKKQNKTKKKQQKKKHLKIISSETICCMRLRLYRNTRGPWWSYIAHMSKQLCILTTKVSAKFTALRFLYKFYYSPAPQWPCFFSSIMMVWTETWKRVTKGTILQSYIEIGPVVSDKKIFKMFYIAI